MKKYFLTALILTLIYLLTGWFDLFAFSNADSETSSFYGTWVSLLPPVIAIGLALLTREVIDTSAEPKVQA